MRKLRRPTIALIAFLALFHDFSKSAQLDAASQAFLQRLNGAITSLAGKAGKSAFSACLSLVRSLMDVDAIARRAADDAWQRMTTARRAAFRAALERRAARNCVGENANNSGEPVVVLGLRGKGAERLLATSAKQKGGGSGRTVVWRLPSGGGRAVDVLVDGRSTALSLRDEVKQILQGGADINTLIATIGQ